MKEEMTRIEIRSLAKITAGQSLEVKDSAGLTWVGTVDIADEKHGVVWVFTNLGERKLVDMEEYSLFGKQVSSGEDASDDQYREWYQGNCGKQADGPRGLGSPVAGTPTTELHRQFPP